MLQLGLDLADGVHHFVHFFGGGIGHFVVKLQHLFSASYISLKAVRSTSRMVWPGLKGALLVEVAYGNTAGPFHFAFVGQQVAGNYIKEGRFAFAVGAYQTNMFSCAVI